MSVTLIETFFHFALFESFPPSVSFAAMSILNYFEKVPKNPLQAMSSVPSEEAGRHVGVVNLTGRETEEVTNEVNMLEKKGRKRRNYIKWTAEERAEIGQHPVRRGVNQTVRLLKGKYPRLTKQTVSDFKKAFIQAKQTAVGPVNEINFRKRGRPALLPDDLMKKTIEMIQALRLNGAPVTAVVINAIDKGIVIANDRALLVEHGGYLSLSLTGEEMSSAEWKEKARRWQSELLRLRTYPWLLDF